MPRNSKIRFTPGVFAASYRFHSTGMHYAAGRCILSLLDNGFATHSADWQGSLYPPGNQERKKLKVVRHCQKLSKIGEDIPIWIHFRIRILHADLDPGGHPYCGPVRIRIRETMEKSQYFG